jgi:hypothetical protein
VFIGLFVYNGGVVVVKRNLMLAHTATFVLTPSASLEYTVGIIALEGYRLW